MRRLITVATVLLGACVGSASCSSSERVDLASAPPPAVFDSIDSGGDGASVDSGSDFLSYCPSNKCPAGHTTCPNSLYPCEVNLLTDVTNCGACGAACPRSRGSAGYQCVNGRCEIACGTSPLAFDCDGIAENGCETPPGSNEHCNGCNSKCLDPAKPCALQPTETFACGCPDDYANCDGICKPIRTDDENCGTCGSACDPEDGPPLPNTYYGCVNGECGKRKCMPYTGDCDNIESNGCEEVTTTKQHCAACGNTCADGQECAFNFMGALMCMCPAGQTFCGGCSGSICFGNCADLSSDAHNCGACGAVCGGAGGVEVESKGVCNFGTCSVECMTGRADCNGNVSDGCEVNTASDPRNCGACGRSCDATIGQACVEGQCVVEPCEQDAGQVGAR